MLKRLVAAVLPILVVAGCTVTLTPSTYTVTINQATGGNISWKSDEVTSLSAFTLADTVLLTATANPGYKFVKWTSNDFSLDQETYSPFWLDISQNTTVSAVFVPTSGWLKFNNICEDTTKLGNFVTYELANFTCSALNYTSSDTIDYGFNSTYEVSNTGSGTYTVVADASQDKGATWTTVEFTVPITVTDGSYEIVSLLSSEMSALSKKALAAKIAK